MTTHAKPSADPANDDSLAGVLREVYKKLLQQTDNMLPAIVVAYDRANNRAQVKPAIALLTTDNRIIPRALIASVPVLQIGGGGLVLNFPLEAGNLGWIHASDRDISRFLETYAVAPPNTVRLHTFQDAVFIPDAMRGWTIAGEDEDAAVLQTLDGSARVSVKTGQVKLTVGAKSVTVTAAGTNIVGGLTVDGVVFGTHRHAPSATGPSNP